MIDVLAVAELKYTQHSALNESVDPEVIVVVAVCGNDR
jgi:hypothetical protein